MSYAELVDWIRAQQRLPEAERSPDLELVVKLAGFRLDAETIAAGRQNGDPGETRHTQYDLTIINLPDRIRWLQDCLDRRKEQQEDRTRLDPPEASGIPPGGFFYLPPGLMPERVQRRPAPFGMWAAGEGSFPLPEAP